MGTLNDGSILVSDYWNYAIKHYAKDGTYLSTLVDASTKGSGVGQHLAPYGIGVDPNVDPNTGDTYFYFGDVDGNCTVDKWAYSPATESANFVTTFGGCGLVTGKLKYPAYLDVGNDSRVYVMDSRNPAAPVVVTDPSGNPLFHFGGPTSPGSYGAGRLDNPRGVGLDGGGRSQWCGGGQCLYIADNRDLVIQVFDTGGHWQYSFAPPGGFAGPNLRGLSVDKVNGLVYVTDATASVIDEFHLDGSFVRRIGSGGTGLGQLQDGGRDLTVDGDGNVWIGDIYNWRAQKFDSSGNFLLQVPNPPVPPLAGGFNAPRAIAVDSRGNIFVTDTTNQRIERFNPDGTFNTEWGVREAAPQGFNYPKGIAADNADGTVIVADSDNVSIKKFSIDGQLIWLDRSTPKGPFKGPEGVAVGADGTIYVADSQNSRIVVLSRSGNPVIAWGTKGTGPGQFDSPQSLAVDPSDGTIWVANALSGTVEHFDAAGCPSGVAPCGTFLGQFGSRGPGSDQFQQPRGIAVDQRNIYVTDVTAAKIKIWSKSTMLPVASFGSGGSGPGQFKRPMGCALGPSSDLSHIDLYTVESDGERVQEFSINV
jgi:DNA-binding beta-propeller fold protein YncE